MKYIKSYSSLIVESVKTDLKEFCELNLAYLCDEDYKVMITRRDSLPIDNSHHKKGLIIHFYKWESDDENFKWGEIENHFIPFLQRLSNEYTVVECQIVYSNYNAPKYVVSLESLINEGLPKERLIEDILVIVEEE
jgi:hypothetical protein